MICKNCGEGLVEGKCSKCGAVSVLESRSTELDRLMQRKPGKDQKSNDQEYQRGFQEGYKNGLNDGVVKYADNQILVEGVPVIKADRFLPFILAAILFLVMTPVSIFCYSKGVKKSEIRAEGRFNQEYAQSQESEYNRDYSEGEENERDSAMNSSEVKLQIQNAYQEGFQAGEKMPKAGMCVEPDLEMKEDPVTSEDKKVDFLYSLEDQNREIEEVRHIQEKLIELGYLEKGSADGYFGDETLTAIRQFQVDQKIPVTEGGIDRSTCEILLSMAVPGDQIEDDATIINADGSELN